MPLYAASRLIKKVRIYDWLSYALGDGQDTFH
jgi:hypothetical protein